MLDGHQQQPDVPDERVEEDDLVAEVDDVNVAAADDVAIPFRWDQPILAFPGEDEACNYHSLTLRLHLAASGVHSGE